MPSAARRDAGERGEGARAASIVHALIVPSPDDGRVTVGSAPAAVLASARAWAVPAWASARGRRLRGRFWRRFRGRLRGRRRLRLGVGSTDGGGGHGIAATSEPDGDGISNDGITPLSSGVGNGMQLGDGLGDAPQLLPVTNGPHVRPYGLNGVVVEVRRPGPVRATGRARARVARGASSHGRPRSQFWNLGSCRCRLDRGHPAGVRRQPRLWARVPARNHSSTPSLPTTGASR